MKDDKEPAFPNSYSGELMPHEGIGGGLTKREWFAAMATDKDVSMAAQTYMAKTGDDTCSSFTARFFHADQMIEASKK